MIFNIVTDAIMARILADTGTGGLRIASPAGWSPIIAGGIWGLQKDPNTTTKPYGVFNLSMVNPRPTFKSDGFVCTARFFLVDDPKNQYGNIAAVMDRLYGNAVDQPGGVPSYGLVRHTLTFPPNAYGLTASAIFAQELIGPEVPDPENLTASMTFTFNVTSKEYT